LFALPNAAATSSLERTPSSDHERSNASVTLDAETTPAIAAYFHSSTPKIAPPATAARALEPKTPKIRRTRVCNLIMVAILPFLDWAGGMQ
jgi:hypothetical protein